MKLAASQRPRRQMIESLEPRLLLTTVIHATDGPDNIAVSVNHFNPPTILVGSQRYEPNDDLIYIYAEGGNDNITMF
jgi:hypothetical protein